MFVHLHCHSQYSFLRGVGTPEEFVAAAAGQKMPAVALTDTNGMYAAVAFYQAARKAGVKPIVGVVVDVAWEETNRRREIPRPPGRARDDGQARSASVVLLAADAEGYSNLCRMVTWRKLGRDAAAQERSSEVASHGSAAKETEENEIIRAAEETEPLKIEDLAEHCAGVVALAPVKDSAPGPVARLKEIFGERL